MKDMERYGNLQCAKNLRRRRQEFNDCIETQTIGEQTWLPFFEAIYQQESIQINKNSAEEPIPITEGKSQEPRVTITDTQVGRTKTNNKAYKIAPNNNEKDEAPKRQKTSIIIPIFSKEK